MNRLDAIKEMDINPLLVHAEGHGATVADCPMVLFDGGQG